MTTTFSLVLILGFAISVGVWAAAGSSKRPSMLPALKSLGNTQARVWRMSKAGKISNLEQVDIPIQPPASGEVTVKVRAVGLNFADVFSMLGLYSATPTGSYVPGLEFAGEVESVGEGVSGFEVKDRVYGFTRFGAYASRLNVSQHYLRKLRADWSFEEGASFVVQGLTAWHGLVELGSLKQGASVLIHSAAGGVGLIAMDMAEKLGAGRIVGTIGSPSKLDFLMERCNISRDQVIVRETQAKKVRAQLFEALKPATDGYDLIMDALGGIHFQEGMGALARNGRMITFGAADYMTTTDRPNWFKVIPRYLSRPRVDPGELMAENKSVMGFNLIWLTDKVVELNKELDDLLAAADWRPPFVGARYAFSEAHAAIKHLQSGTSVGKVVLTLDH